MEYRRACLAFAAAVGVSTLVQIGPAHADAVTDNAVGTYTLTWGTNPEPTLKWVLTPCDDDAPRCIKVDQYWLSGTKPLMTGTAFWTVGSWVLNIGNVPDLITCTDNDQKFDFPATASWDDSTLEGNRSYLDPGLCGGDTKGKDVTSKFVLKKVSSDAASSVPPASEAPPPPSTTPPTPAAPPAPPAEPATPPPTESPAPPPPAPGAAESSAPPPAA